MSATLVRMLFLAALAPLLQSAWAQVPSWSPSPRRAAASASTTPR